MARSQFLGVYNVAADKQQDGKAFRVALKIKDRKTDEFSWFNAPEHFSTEEAAARVYNVYAVAFFGKGAILNVVEGTDAGDREVLMYFLANENRQQTMKKNQEKRDRMIQAGHVFRTHLELRN